MEVRIQKHRLVEMSVLIVLLLGSRALAELQLEFPGLQPGLAQGKISRGELILENKVLACTWVIDEGKLIPNSINDKLS